MIDPATFPISSIPEGCIIVSWYNIKLLAGGSFALGFLANSAISYLKARYDTGLKLPTFEDQL